MYQKNLKQKIKPTEHRPFDFVPASGQDLRYPFHHRSPDQFPHNQSLTAVTCPALALLASLQTKPNASLCWNFFNYFLSHNQFLLGFHNRPCWSWMLSLFVVDFYSLRCFGGVRYRFLLITIKFWNSSVVVFLSLSTFIYYSGYCYR